MVTVSTPNPKQHGLFSTRVVDRGFGACKGGGDQCTQNTTCHKMHLFDLQVRCCCVPDLLPYLHWFVFSTKRSFGVWLHKQRASRAKICTINFGQRLLPILRTRDRATSRPTLPIHGWCFCSLSPRAIGRFFQRKRQRAEIFFF
jgi:hypothetical protein